LGAIDSPAHRHKQGSLGFGGEHRLVLDWRRYFRQGIRIEGRANTQPGDGFLSKRNAGEVIGHARQRVDRR
jgi:hypothetical protein